MVMPSTNPTVNSPANSSAANPPVDPEVLAACRRKLSSFDEAMQSLQIKGEADQGPLTLNLVQASQRELTKSNCLLDDSNHGFNRTFSQSIDRLTFISFKSGSPAVCVEHIF